MYMELLEAIELAPASFSLWVEVSVNALMLVKQAALRLSSVLGTISRSCS